MTTYHVEVLGPWAGATGRGWNPGVAGTLNQSGWSDDIASTFEDEDEATMAAHEVVAAGALKSHVRIRVEKG